jgi:hypothetical protein
MAKVTVSIQDDLLARAEERFRSAGSFEAAELVRNDRSARS